MHNNTLTESVEVVFKQLFLISGQEKSGVKFLNTIFVISKILLLIDVSLFYVSPRKGKHCQINYEPSQAIRCILIYKILKCEKVPLLISVICGIHLMNAFLQGDKVISNVSSLMKLTQRENFKNVHLRHLAFWKQILAPQKKNLRIPYEFCGQMV